ncbi:uncharacterized protein [Miscanthus floridulus]|uniref:uncharacterized protein n=1 Tax=Miscanthus floridulus TaxID=154761 RepID=UPI003459ABFB
MVAVVEVDAGQEAKRGKATDEEGQWTPPPPPQPVEVARKPRQPTPDHPPYCWMIGEAIDALAEDGGSSEDSISAFICARHPGVPPAHDRLLRHYLGKHVAEGIFVRTAAGRYERCPEENADEVLLLEQAEAGSCKVASVEAKRGRGRPRSDGSPSTPPAGRKDGGAGALWMTPPAGSSLTLAAAAKDSVPVSPVAVADKDESQAQSLKPKRRGRLRRLGMATTTDSSGEALVAGKKHGSEVSYTLDKEHEPPRELGLVILGDSSAASTMDKACTEVSPTTPPVDGDQPLDLALVTTTEVPLPEPASTPTPAMDKDGGQPLDLALVTTTEVPVPVPEPAPAPTPTPAMDKDGDQPLDPALVTSTEVPVSEPAPMPTPDMDKDGGDASSIVDKNENIWTAPTAPEPGSQACKLALMAAAAAGFVPVLVANKKGGLKEAPSASYKDVLQPRKAGSAPTAGKKAGGKALSATPKGRRRQHKSAAVATGDQSALTPGKKLGCKVSFASPKLTPVIAGGCPTPASVADQGGMETSAALKQHGQPHKLMLKKKPRKLYPVTADEISDDPGFVLLALPSQTLAASNA